MMQVDFLFFFFSSRRRHTRCREVSWARRCVQETDAEYMGKSDREIGQVLRAAASGFLISFLRSLRAEFKDKIDMLHIDTQGWKLHNVESTFRRAIGYSKCTSFTQYIHQKKKKKKKKKNNK
eukprot:TRINITY_DN43593_c0_g1_i1.p1 TRINITY_DN43593_c0_g1~~TRINITY_DN43593_c0_g1_i1.p1  ORF type:complete len:122 (-),score=52.73 TRINITY_DN43593_c0_g1_i1:53-418(-)